MTVMTKQQQYRSVSAGFALGLIMNDCYEIPDYKPAVESAFGSAWRNWKYRNALPSADKTLSGARKDVDVIWILLDLDKDKKKPYVPFHWDDHTVIVRPAADFDSTDQEDLDQYAENICDEIPAQAWADLAKDFLEKLNVG